MTEQKLSLSPIKVHGGLISLILNFPIYLTFKSETEKLVYTICGLWEKVKKPGLVKYWLFGETNNFQLLDLTTICGKSYELYRAQQT